MRAHTIIVKTERAVDIPYFVGGRAAILLGNRAGCSHARIVNDHVAVFEIHAPNMVSANEVLTAVNRSIAEYVPGLSPLQWETGIFSTVDCINQDL